MPGEEICPFSNGSEGDGWLDLNCMTCVKWTEPDEPLKCSMLNRVLGGMLSVEDISRIGGTATLYERAGKVGYSVSMPSRCREWTDDEAAIPTPDVPGQTFLFGGP